VLAGEPAADFANGVGCLNALEAFGLSRFLKSTTTLISLLNVQDSAFRIRKPEEFLRLFLF
jgi:hypothetical protein